MYGIFCDLPKIQAGGGVTTPQEFRSNHSKWLKESGIASSLPLTWHQARPQSKQDLEIYKYAVQLWDAERRRLHYDDLPEYLKAIKVETPLSIALK